MFLMRLFLLLSLAGAAVSTALPGNTLTGTQAVKHHARAERIHCIPFLMNFDSSTSGPDFERNFAPLSPPDSYSLDADGLKLFLDKPAGRINTKGNVNDKVAEGATFNSTFTVRYADIISSRSLSCSLYAGTAKSPTPCPAPQFLA